MFSVFVFILIYFSFNFQSNNIAECFCDIWISMYQNITYAGLPVFFSAIEAEELKFWLEKVDKKLLKLHAYNDKKTK